MEELAYGWEAWCLLLFWLVKQITIAQGEIFIFIMLSFLFFPTALFPFLRPVYEALNISVFPKSVTDFFIKSVKRMKESRLKNKETVKYGGSYTKLFTFHNVLSCTQDLCTSVYFFSGGEISRF